LIGRISFFNDKNASGVISAEGGAALDFDVSEVLEYDVSGLATGQLVHFDLARGSSHKAINVSIHAFETNHSTETRFREISRLRYLGFEQQGNVRAYTFERVSPGEEKNTFTVHIDLILFKRHHVVIQEGPALCMRLLAAELERPGAGDRPFFPCSITDQYMLAYLASKPAPGSKPRRKNSQASAVLAHHA